jgi:hypothetical protein
MMVKGQEVEAQKCEPAFKLYHGGTLVALQASSFKVDSELLD